LSRGAVYGVLSLRKVNVGAEHNEQLSRQQRGPVIAQFPPVTLAKANEILLSKRKAN
jgi:hypothetical protein